MRDVEAHDGQTLALARHWLEVGRPERCLDVLRAGGDTAGTPGAFELRTAALLDLDRDADAAAQARAGLAIDADNTRLLTMLGIACRSTGDFAAGEQALLSALRSEPEDAWILGQYALLLVTAGRLDKAKRVAEAASRVDPEQSVVRYARSVIAHVEGRDGDAAEIARQTLADNPEDLDSHALLGTYSLGEGRVATGADHWRTAASIRPEGRIAQVAREASVLAHPALLPIRLAYRFGTAKVWIAALVVIGGLTAAGLEGPATVAAFVYVAFVVYSWVGPPLVRAWLRRRR